MSSIAEKPTPNLELIFAGSNTDALGRTPVARRFQQIATTVEIAGDYCTVASAMCLSYLAYHWLGLGRRIHYPPTEVATAAMVIALLFVIMLERDGAYRQGDGLLRVRETERTLRVSVQTFLLALPVSFLAAHLVSRYVLGIAFLLVPLCLITEKQFFYVLIRALHLRGWGVQKVLIYGAGFTGKRVFSALVRSPKLGFNPVAVIDDDPERAGDEIYAFGYRRERSAPVVAGPLTAKLVRSYGAEMVVIAIPTLDREAFTRVAEVAAQSDARLAFVPTQAVSTDFWLDYADIDGLMLASFGNPASKSIYELAKRGFDFVVSAAILFFLSPLLLALGIAVRLDSNGPVIFRQRRVGKNGRLFDMYKFRSMHIDAPAYSFSPKQAQDPRITRVGRFLRKTSLDELPQLFNVLRGEMSLVGPRPEMPFIVEQYGPRERNRLSVMPGITGLWQLSADRAYLIHENLQYDLYYIRHRSFLMDFSILLHTAIFAMRGV
jgi:exopolysaccharide biosynthesis polyprenyl glycosylphosphotransferase